MVKILVVSIIVFLLLVTAEYMWRVKHYRSEITRKFVHITVGTFVAFWPWFLSWDQIEILAGLFFLVILTSRLLTILSSIHLIGRKTVGEIFFALCIAGTALITHDRYIFMAALLHLSIADGLAAVIGTHFGHKARYTVFGQRKSLIGSLTFLVCSYLIFGLYAMLSHSGFSPLFIGLPPLLMLIENLGTHGSDNLLLPLITAACLRFLT